MGPALWDGEASGWLRAYALLVLRVDRRVRDRSVWSMDYYGPEEWRREAQAEELPPAGRLVDDAEHLLDTLPYAGARGEYVGAQLHALRALVGPSLPLPELVRDCLGLRVAPLPESVFERAHAQLDRSLPGGSGSLAQRLHDWTRRHELPLEHLSRLPAMVDRAVTETRARTRAAIVTLPADEVVDCEVVPGAPFLAAGWHRGGTRSTILVTGDRPFNLADLLYVVAHEGHPGHIAEQVLKEIHLVRRQGRAEQLLRFLPSPPHVLSEGLGLHAQSLIFPGGQAQDWLTGTVLGEAGIEPDGSDFAGIHGARDVLFGVRANAALLAAEGRPEAEVAAYLRRWALLDDQQTRTAVRALTVPGGNPYIFAYYYGRELVGAWLAAGPNPAARVRRLLTEQLLPADLATP